MTADRQWLLASIRFGFHIGKLLSWLYWAINEQDPEGLQKRRLQVQLGHCRDLYDIGYFGNDVRELYPSIEAGHGTAAVDPTAFENPPPIPSLPFEGPTSSTLIPEHQAPFMHPKVNRKDALTLLLLPHNSSPNSPIRCGLIDAPTTDPPPFKYILNSSLHHPRKTTPILINNQSLPIPQNLELFLRRIRDPDHGQFLSVWRICMYPHQAKIQDREDLDEYYNAMAFMFYKSAEAVNIYRVLDDPEGVGCDELPVGMMWNEWLLELND